MRAGRKRKTPVTLPGRGGQEIVIASVPDPYDPGTTLAVQRVSNGTPLSYLYHRGRLQGPGEDTQDGASRWLSGNWLRQQFELAGGTGARGMDPSAVIVDTSPRYETLTERQAQAFKSLRAVAGAIGLKYPLVHKICCEEVNFLAAVQHLTMDPHPSRSTRLLYYDLLREALDAITEYRGVARGPRYGKIRAG